MNKPRVTCGYDWLENKLPRDGLICILLAGHSDPHLYCRESDIFQDTPNSEAVRFLRDHIVDLNALIETLTLDKPK